MQANENVNVPETSFEYALRLTSDLSRLSEHVATMKSNGDLSPSVLSQMQQFFRIRDIYNSNAIEGNSLDIGETKRVVEDGSAISGRSAVDQREARNLSEALQYVEALSVDLEEEIGETHVRQIHKLVLNGIDDDNAGKYRTGEAIVSGSEIPLSAPEKIGPEMGDFTRWLRSRLNLNSLNVELDPIVFAAAVHAWFVQIHPFVDGNGRTARILMNLVLRRHGYPVGIITREDRQRYYDALQESEGSDLTPLITLIVETVEDSLQEWETAAREQRQLGEWTSSLASRLTQPQQITETTNYAVWKNAMELFKSYVKNVQQSFYSSLLGTSWRLYVRDYDVIEFEKYQSLSKGISAKQTWFFRIDLVNDKDRSNSNRYLFVFGYPGSLMNQVIQEATLHIYREEPRASFNYVLLVNSPILDRSSFVEIAYQQSKENLLVSKGNVELIEMDMQEFAKTFIEMVVNEVSNSRGPEG